MRLHTSTPSRSGSPRSSTITSGRVIAVSDRPSLAVSAVRTACPRAARPTRQTVSRSGSSSTMSTCGNLLLLLGGELRGRDREAEPGAATGGVIDPDALVVCFDEGLRDGQPDRPASASSSRRASRPKTSSRRSALTPGPWSATETTTVPGEPGVAPTMIGVPLGACRTAFSSMFVSTRDMRVTSTSTGGSPSSMASRTVNPRRPGTRSPTTPVTRSPTWVSVRRGHTPASIRLMSSRFWTRCASRSASASMSLAKACAASGGDVEFVVGQRG